MSPRFRIIGRIILKTSAFVAEEIRKMCMMKVESIEKSIESTLHAGKKD